MIDGGSFKMQPNTAGFAIRPAVPDDEGALSDICVRTINAGDDGSDRYGDPRFPGLIWAVPYERFHPEHAFVLTLDGAVAGYVLGVPDTVAFEDRLEAEWWPALRREFAGRRPVAPGDAAILGWIERPPRIPAEIGERYPAHLHIDLLPTARGRGLGGAMIERILASFIDRGVRGVHLGVNVNNEGVTAFYAKSGFREIARLPSIIMARDL